MGIRVKVRTIALFEPGDVALDKAEIRLNLDGQWFYRGNRSPRWMAMASRLDGSMCGIAESVPAEYWPVLERVAYLEKAMRAVEQVLSGRQLVDVPGALMVIRNALSERV